MTAGTDRSSLSPGAFVRLTGCDSHGLDLSGMTGRVRQVQGEWVLVAMTAWPVTIRVRLADVRVERTAA